mmetsp:Transcript_10506/g.48253  ORF Transcript_10506/g.48253 Transcript_10506/m.48253 type:complete len:326 (-) Transcript_10506:466-1443(-)
MALARSPAFRSRSAFSRSVSGPSPPAPPPPSGKSPVGDDEKSSAPPSSSPASIEPPFRAEPPGGGTRCIVPTERIRPTRTPQRAARFAAAAFGLDGLYLRIASASRSLRSRIRSFSESRLRAAGDFGRLFFFGDFTFGDAGVFFASLTSSSWLASPSIESSSSSESLSPVPPLNCSATLSTCLLNQLPNASNDSSGLSPSTAPSAPSTSSASIAGDPASRPGSPGSSSGGGLGGRRTSGGRWSASTAMNTPNSPNFLTNSRAAGAGLKPLLDGAVALDEDASFPSPASVSSGAAGASRAGWMSAFAGSIRSPSPSLSSPSLVAPA